jgi:Squalene/phytoene synthase
LRLPACGSGARRELVTARMPEVTEAFRALPDARARKIIAGTLRLMAAGMAKAVERGFAFETFDELHEYCGYVADTIAFAVTHLFFRDDDDGELEAAGAMAAVVKSFTMLLFKSDMVSDVAEDFAESGRILWPREMWGGRHGLARFSDLFRAEHRAAALRCLNDMVVNALACHLPSALACTLGMLHGCANAKGGGVVIVGMAGAAVATLVLCYNNEAMLSKAEQQDEDEFARLPWADTMRLLALGESADTRGMLAAIEQHLRALLAKTQQARGEAEEQEDAATAALAADHAVRVEALVMHVRLLQRGMSAAASC